MKESKKKMKTIWDQSRKTATNGRRINGQQMSKSIKCTDTFYDERMQTGDVWNFHRSHHTQPLATARQREVLPRMRGMDYNFRWNILIHSVDDDIECMSATVIWCSNWYCLDSLYDDCVFNIMRERCVPVPVFDYWAPSTGHIDCVKYSRTNEPDVSLPRTRSDLFRI